MICGLLKVWLLMEWVRDLDREVAGLNLLDNSSHCLSLFTWQLSQGLAGGLNLRARRSPASEDHPGVVVGVSLVMRGRKQVWEKVHIKRATF